MIDKERLKNKLTELTFLSQEEQKQTQKIKYNKILVNESIQTNPNNILPELISVDSKHRLWEVWKSIEENVSSFVFRRSPGRNCYFLIINKYDNKNLGIIDVAADFLSLGKRDEYIGWNKEQKKKYNRNIANISVCVPTRHFGYNLSGGKLLALLAISNQIGEHWKDKYKDELAGVTVTSLYGRGSQYNRLKYFKYLGKTKGQGTCQIPDELYKQCRLVVEEYEGKIPGGCFTKGKNSRINIIRKACKYLEIDASLLTTHNRQRGIYWCDRGYNTKEFLTGKDIIFTEKNLNQNDLHKYWVNEWAERRIYNLKKKIV